MRAISIVCLVASLSSLAGCGSSGHGEVAEGKDAVEKKQTVDTTPPKKDSSGVGSEKDGVACDEKTNDIGWCVDEYTMVFCAGAEKKWYTFDCRKLPGSDDEVCGVRKGQTHVVCDVASKFE